MARPISLMTNQISAVRTKSGSPVAADSGTLTDANFPLLASSTTGGTIDCRALATIWIGVEFTGGTTPTIDLDPLIRDEEAADGARWKRLLTASGPAVYQPTLDGVGFVEIRVDGGQMYPRIKAVTGNPTQVVLLARPGTLLNTGKGLTSGSV